ncbi:Ingression protein fic1 [Cyphellophora attinorum]|uniref:Ingression protein fic1 n=1 Tax=Cyphellophora attinorum TaxID=1664694 RepID=A0A0N1NZ71_9EURO|nr:Ingression protein fic1 [Phialophora attinorum]KPI40436.1 Ingression protein fic1 [Phialophora attinorum]
MATKRTMPAGHTAGIFADMTLDGPEIGTLVAIIDRAKNLPNRKTMGKQDPYCAMRLGKEAKKTNTDRRGGQTPRWDQELRFTVREAPDYYKLKCSVFNDDKKTDLIGEAWIDLTELIVPGGKAQDFWQQLSYKGKYAGDIRLEMTYYDTKHNPEIEATKERQRQRANTPNSDAGSLSGPRQLGPREIKRRPLPTGRSNNSSPAGSPAYISPEYRPQPQQWNGGPEGPDDYNQYCQPQYQEPYAPVQDPFAADARYDQEPYYHPEPTLPQIPMPQHPPLETRRSDPTPLSSSPHPSSPHANYSSSPPTRSSPGDPRRMSASPTKYAAYRDSPLRHSTTHQDIPVASTASASSTSSYLPKPLALSYDTPAQQSQPQCHESIGDRSPLQMIEHNFAPQQTSRSPRKSFNPSEEPVQRPTSSAGEFPAPHQITPNYGVDFMADPVEQDQRGRYIRRNSFLDDYDDPYKAPQRAQTFDSADFDHRNTFSSEPQLVRPRAVSPNPNHAVPRKSVSPAPPIERYSGSIPFGPDSFNSFNPASSQGSAHRDWAESPRNEKLHEIEPIIGNDGRVIDPSDHLPSDTWAPEPERKNRQPEHVIHIRTKGSAQHTRAGSSPAAPKALSIPSSPYNNHNSSPAPLEPITTPTSGRRRLQKAPPSTRPLPQQPYPTQHANSSPGAIPQTQHFDTTSQPQQQHIRPRSSAGPPSQQPRPHRNSFNNSPHSAGQTARPPLSDYQVPISPTTTPTKVQMPRPQSYAPPSVYDDPLAAELSMIDIGPSRSGQRTALRGGGGGGGRYGGY